MKIIELLNKIANGEEVPKKIRIDHWCYNFEWVEHDSNYYDKHEDIDLMSCLSMSEEELNYGIQIIEEDKKIEKIGSLLYCETTVESILHRKIDEIIDAINELKGKSE